MLKGALKFLSLLNIVQIAATTLGEKFYWIINFTGLLQPVVIVILHVECGIGYLLLTFFCPAEENVIGVQILLQLCACWFSEFFILKPQGHSSNTRTLIMHSMAEWYMRGEPHDQVRLSRILDVAQDLKVCEYVIINVSGIPVCILL